LPEALGDMGLNEDNRERYYLWRNVSYVGRTERERREGGGSKHAQTFARTVLGEYRLKLGVSTNQRKEGVKFMPVYKVQSTKQVH